MPRGRANVGRRVLASASLRARAGMLGVTPGTLHAVRGEHLVKSAREPRTPTADLIGVCVADAESLNVTMTELRPDVSPRSSDAKPPLTALLLLLAAVC